MIKILVIAKAPVAGRVKTRLCPPCVPDEAATIARAALADTLDAVCGVEEAEPVVVLDGEPGSWLPAATRVIRQRDGGLADRIAGAFADAGSPAILIGMDTPQVTPNLLRHACDLLARPGTDALLGDAHDGGWWVAGLKRIDDRAFAGVPMSTAHTARAQLLRFRELGLTVTALPRLRDVDTFEDAVSVAGDIPSSRFAAAVTAIARRIDGGPDARLAEAIA